MQLLNMGSNGSQDAVSMKLNLSVWICDAGKLR